LKNKKIISGIILLVVAFFVLSKTDPYIGWGIIKK